MTTSRTRLKDLLYGAIVGLDSDAQQLGGERYFLHIVDWHSNSKSALWSRWGRHWSANRGSFVPRCDNALRLAFNSNRCLIAKESAPQRGTSDLALLRIIASIGSEVTDSGIDAAARANRSFASDVWQGLSEWFPGVEDQAGEMLLLWGKTDKRLDEKWQQQLKALLEGVLWKNRINLHLLGATAEGTQSALAPVRGEWLEGALLRLKTQVEAGDYDKLPLGRKIRLLNLLEEAQLAFGERASSNLEAPKEAPVKRGSIQRIAKPSEQGGELEAAMASYYVNKNAQANGDHEVHELNCSFIPAQENRIYLGDFSNCREAVREARKHYSQINGCYYCANACHSQ